MNDDIIDWTLCITSNTCTCFWSMDLNRFNDIYYVLHFKTYMEKQPVKSCCKDMFSVGGHFSFAIEATLPNIINDYLRFQIMYGLSSSNIPANEKSDNICLFGVNIQDK